MVGHFLINCFYTSSYSRIGLSAHCYIQKEWSPIIAPIYALVEGVFVGAVSLMYASLFDGIIFHAVSLTIGVLFLMLFLYKAKIIEVTQRLRSVIMMATGAIMLTYLVSFVLSFSIFKFQ